MVSIRWWLRRITLFEDLKRHTQALKVSNNNIHANYIIYDDFYEVNCINDVCITYIYTMWNTMCITLCIQKKYILKSNYYD